MHAGLGRNIAVIILSAVTASAIGAAICRRRFVTN